MRDRMLRSETDGCSLTNKPLPENVWQATRLIRCSSFDEIGPALPLGLNVTFALLDLESKSR